MIKHKQGKVLGGFIQSIFISPLYLEEFLWRAASNSELNHTPWWIQERKKVQASVSWPCSSRCRALQTGECSTADQREPPFPLLQCLVLNITFLSVLFLFQFPFPWAEFKVFLKSFCSASSRVVLNRSCCSFPSCRLVAPVGITALAWFMWPFPDSSRETMGKEEHTLTVNNPLLWSVSSSCFHYLLKQCYWPQVFLTLTQERYLLFWESHFQVTY